MDTNKVNEGQVGGDHYKNRAARCNRCDHEMQHWDISWALGWDQFQYCITKYVFRHKYKNGLEDLRKARHHLDKYIELLEGEQPKDSKELIRNVIHNALRGEGADPGPGYVNQDGPVPHRDHYLGCWDQEERRDPQRKLPPSAPRRFRRATD